MNLPISIIYLQVKQKIQKHFKIMNNTFGETSNLQFDVRDIYGGIKTNTYSKVQVKTNEIDKVDFIVAPV